MTRPTYTRDGPVRWRDDTGWELRCESCAAGKRQRFWPLTEEFWDVKRGTKRCRACNKEAEAARFRERYRNDPTFRARKRATNDALRAAEKDVRGVIGAKRWQEKRAKLEADAEAYAAYRAAATEAQRRYRARLRERGEVAA